MVKRPLSLSARLGLTLATGLLLFGMLVGAVAYQGAAEILYQAAQNRALALARQLATFSVDAVLVYDYATLERYVGQLGHEPQISFIEVRGGDGELLARAGDHPARDDQRFFLINEPMQLGNTEIGRVVIAYDQWPEQRTLWWSSAIGFFALAVLAIAAFWLQRRVLDRCMIRPVQELARTASPLRAAHCPDPSGLPEELQRLATIFRDLCQEVQTHLDERAQSEQLARIAIERLCHEQRLASVGQMAAGLAHALNTPLGNIRGYAQLSRERSADPKVQQSLTVIEEQVEICANVVKNLLAAARPPQTTLSIFDLHNHIENILLLMRPVLRDKGVDIIDLKGSEALPVLADPAALEQILFNLFSNAAQAGASRLTVSLGGEATRMRISVADDGPGLPESVQQQLFSAFNTTKPPGEGTGLGLHLCRSLAEAMGGEITLVATGVGGTRFDIHLNHAPEPKE